MQLTGMQDARTLLVAFHGWFGPPLVMSRHYRRVGLDRCASRAGEAACWDGQIRLRAWQSLSMPGPPPTVCAETRHELARLVLLAGHPERVREVLGDSVVYDETLSALLRVPPEAATEVLVSQMNKSKRRKAPRRALDVVERVRLLHRNMLEDGYRASPEQIAACLGEWLV